MIVVLLHIIHKIEQKSQNLSSFNVHKQNKSRLGTFCPTVERRMVPWVEAEQGPGQQDENSQAGPQSVQ